MHFLQWLQGSPEVHNPLLGTSALVTSKDLSSSTKSAIQMTHLPNNEKKTLQKTFYPCADIRKDSEGWGWVRHPCLGLVGPIFSSTLFLRVSGAEVPSLDEAMRFGSESVCPCLPSFCGPRCRLLWCLPWTHLIGHVSAQLLSWSKSWWIFPVLCPRPQLAT